MMLAYPPNGIIGIAYLCNLVFILNIMDLQKTLRNQIEKQIEFYGTMAGDQELLKNLESAIAMVIKAYQNNKKVWFAGNGGSAADAQHLAAELSGRFYKTRIALNAEALHCNTSYLTAVANDFGYDVIYSRMIEGVANADDILIVFSTSGNSPNILLAVEAAQSKGVKTIAFTGKGGGKLIGNCDLLLALPSHDTPRIQEGYMHLGHLLCEHVEKALFPG